MIIKKIELDHFRNYDHLVLEPHEGINLFYGPNGSGKTNLLEAVHYCALGKSHRVSQDQNTVMIGQKNAYCSVSVQSKYVRSDIQVNLQPGESVKKTIFVDHLRISRFSELMGKLRCVLFSPEDLGMIRGGPASRRRFLDMMISQISPVYFIALQQYRVAAEQRSAILKNCRIRGESIPSMTEDFENAMAEHAMVIFRERQKTVSRLSDQITEIYEKISGREKETLRLQYRSFAAGSDHPKQEMLRVLRENREEDMRLSQTSCGPHRDDLVITLNQKDMKVFASQGQVRTAALCFRLSQLNVLESFGGERPVLLMDDVMSELDKQRRMNLLKEIGDTQTFITFSDESDLDAMEEKRSYYVFSRGGTAVVEEKSSGTVQEKFILKEPDFT